MSSGFRSAAAPIRLAIVEDEELFRDMLRIVLDAQPTLDVVGEYRTAEDALAGAPETRPDVVLLDLGLAGSGMSGIELGVRLREILPRIGIVVLSNHADPAFLSAMTAEDLSGWSYLLKRSVADVGSLVRAIMGSAMGIVVLDPQLIKVRVARSSGSLAGLTPRQLQILALIAQGYTNNAIADKLALASKSVENQINAIYRQMGMEAADGTTHSRVKATLAYLEGTRSLAV